MELINELERLELLELVQGYGFSKGAQLYWLHRFKNLPENQNKNRRDLERELVEIIRIPKLLKSNFDKTYALYVKTQNKLMSESNKSKIRLILK